MGFVNGKGNGGGKKPEGAKPSRLCEPLSWVVPALVICAFVVLDCLFVSEDSAQAISTYAIYGLFVLLGGAIYMYEETSTASLQAQQAKRLKAKRLAARARPAKRPERPSQEDLLAHQKHVRLNRALVDEGLTSVDKVLGVVDEHLTDFDSVNLVTAISRCAKLGYGKEHEIFKDERFQSVICEFEKFVEECWKDKHVVTREVSNAVWGLAKLGMTPTEPNLRLLTLLAKVTEMHLKEFKAQELSNTVWGIATIAAKGEGPEKEGAEVPLMFRRLPLEARMQFTCLFKAVAETSAGRLKNFRTQELSNTIWAFAKSMQNSPLTRLSDCQDQDALVGALRLFFRTVARECRQQVAEFESQHFANTAWAFATIDVLSPEEAQAFFQSIADAIETAGVETFKPQELANLAWSFSKSTKSWCCKSVMNLIMAKAMRSDFSQFKPKDFTNISWSFAVRGYMSPPIARGLLKAALSVKSKFNITELCSFGYSIARSGTGGVEIQEMIRELAEEVLSRSEAVKEHPLVNLTWTLAKTGAMDKNLYMKLIENIKTIHLRDSEVSTVVWALGRCASAVKDADDITALKAWFEKLGEEILPRIRLMGSGDLATIVCGFARADCFPRPLFKAAKLRKVFFPRSAVKPREIIMFNWAFELAFEHGCCGR